MNYRKKKIKKRLENVPLRNRVWIYNAELIIEFLNRTYMPTKFFLSTEGALRGKEDDLLEEDFQGFQNTQRISLDDLYEGYLLFREKENYTAEIESKYKFSLILNKMNYQFNRWEFRKSRYSRNQIIMYGPLQKRADFTADVRAGYPIEKTTLEGGQVEVNFQDMQSDGEELRDPDTLEKMINEGASGIEENKTIDRIWFEAVEIIWEEVRDWQEAQ